MSDLFLTFVAMSASGALLALLVVVGRAVITRRPGPFLPLLYALLMLRLALPLFVPSQLSILNQLQLTPAQAPAVTAQSVFDTPVSPISNDVPYETAYVARAADAAVLPSEFTDDTTTQPGINTLTPNEIMSIVWLAGSGLLTAVVIAGYIRFTRTLRHNRAYAVTDFPALLESCRQQLGLRRRIRVVQAQGVNAAAVFGVFRPKLLISPETFAPLTREQQRHVLLHELSHIRRYDALACLFATILCIAHWFNPLVWLCFVLMRRDIEVLCDNSVIRALGDDRHSYAATLLELVSKPKTPRLVKALFISRSHSHVKSRIIAIARHKKATALSTALSLALTLMIAVTGCTASVTDTPLESPQAEPASAPAKTIDPDLSDVTIPYTTYTTGFSGDIQDNDRVEDIPSSVATPSASFVLDTSMLGSDRLTANMKTAANLLDGYTLAPGDKLSLSQLFSLPGSWQIAPDIQDGSWTYTTGGGLCMVATAIYNAAIRAGLEVVEVVHDELPAQFMAGGMDADFSFSGPNLIIANPYESTVSLAASCSGHVLTVSVFGPKLDYSIDFYSELISETEKPESVYEYNVETTPDGHPIAPGQSVQLAFSRCRKVFNVYKTLKDSSGIVIKSELFEKVIYPAKTGKVYANEPDPAKAHR